ncbi:MAG: phage antirepressor KilAC domain-containing protein [Eubacteriales bacterium]|nr:phage antirepressor KilAC domain-containing protein [Eubacteriales bacterium]
METKKAITQIFSSKEFGDVRLMKDGEQILFSATDVARCLGYKNPHDAIRRHCKGTPLAKHEGVSITVNQHGTTTTQTVEMAFITEGNVYRLIAHSKLPAAVEFEKWIFEELLPAIRKYGAYMTDSVLEQVQENPEMIYSIAEKLLAEREKSKVLEGRLRIAQPKADYFDAFVNQDDLICIRVAVKELASTREKQLIKSLLDKKYLYRGKDEKKTLLPTAEAVAKGYFVVKEVHIKNSRKTVPQTFFTPKGKDHVRLQIEKGRLG